MNAYECTTNDPPVERATCAWHGRRRIACDELRPTGIVWYGADAYGCSGYPRSLGIPIHVFKGRGRGKIEGDRRGWR